MNLKFKLSPQRLVIAVALVIAFCLLFGRVYRFYKRVAKLPTTQSVLMALSGIAANWEMWTLANRQPGDSFSATIFKMSREQTFIPFMYGMTGAHLFGGDEATWQAFLDGIEAGKKHWPLLDKEQVEEVQTV